MIYLFRIISDEGQDFFRDLVIEGSDTFLDFHRALQLDLGYDPTQLASFFITNEMWEKEHEITLIDMMEDSGIKKATMNDASIQDHISDENQRMIYVYDFFSERAFFIELIEKSEDSTEKKTPFIGHSEGDPPPQLALDLLLDEFDETLDEFDPERMQDNISLDDLDPDNFEADFPDDF